MPMHDWTRANAGAYHDFHQDWAIEIKRHLNAGRLPAGYFAMTDQHVAGPIPDVITLQGIAEEPDKSGSVALKTSPPKTRYLAKMNNALEYAKRANQIRIFNKFNRVVAIVELVSPGNKISEQNTKEFVAKLREFVNRSVNILVIDPFPPKKHDLGGLHRLLCSELGEDNAEPLPPEQPLLAMAVDAAGECSVYAEPFAVGQPIPQMPLFLAPGQYVDAPIEEAYRVSWDVLPNILKNELLG